jgi:hypothetical protein
MTVIDPDGSLPVARRRLADAVAALVNPRPEWDNGTCRWVDSVYVRLRGGLSGKAGVSGGRLLPGSRLPCRANALSLLVEIDQYTARWFPDEKTTAGRLQQLASKDWRPQDCALLDGYSRRIETWLTAAAELLGQAAVVVPLPYPCPSCEESWAYRRDNGGDLVRIRVLRVSEAGAECLRCGAEWEPERFEWLARLLGCKSLV